MYDADISIWLVKGFCPEFYRGLEKFSRRLYKKFAVNESWDFFYDNVRTKVEEVLSVGAYDSSKGTFKSFIFGMIRNEGTKATSKNRKKVCIDDPYNEKIRFNLTGSQLPIEIAAHRFREDFVQRAQDLFIPIDKDEFESDLMVGRVTPLVLAYLWLLHEGGGRELGLRS